MLWTDLPSWKNWPAITQRITCSGRDWPERGAVFSRTVDLTISVTRNKLTKSCFFKSVPPCICVTDSQPVYQHLAQCHSKCRWLSSGRIVTIHKLNYASVFCFWIVFFPLRAYHKFFLLLALLSQMKWRDGGSDFSALTHYCIWQQHLHKTNKLPQRRLQSLWKTDAKNHSLYLYFHVLGIFRVKGWGIQQIFSNFRPSGQIWPVCPFYSQSLLGLAAPQTHSHHQTTCEQDTDCVFVFMTSF